MLLKSFTKGLQALEILWAKVQKQKFFFADKFRNLAPIFLKLVNFGP